MVAPTTATNTYGRDESDSAADLASPDHRGRPPVAVRIDGVGHAYPTTRPSAVTALARALGNPASAGNVVRVAPRTCRPAQCPRRTPTRTTTPPALTSVAVPGADTSTVEHRSPTTGCSCSEYPPGHAVPRHDRPATSVAVLSTRESTPPSGLRLVDGVPVMAFFRLPVLSGADDLPAHVSSMSLSPSPLWLLHHAEVANSGSRVDTGDAVVSGTSAAVVGCRGFANHCSETGSAHAPVGTAHAVDDQRVPQPQRAGRGLPAQPRAELRAARCAPMAAFPSPIARNDRWSPAQRCKPYSFTPVGRSPPRTAANAAS